MKKCFLKSPKQFDKRTSNHFSAKNRKLIKSDSMQNMIHCAMEWSAMPNITKNLSWREIELGEQEWNLEQGVNIAQQRNWTMSREY